MDFPEFIAARIVDYNDTSDLFRIRWTGYHPHEDTSEPAHHIPGHFIARYFARTGRKPPAPYASAPHYCE